MSHHTSKGGYQALMERLNKYPQGAPPSELLFKIFAILFTEQEAALLSQLPLRPFSAAKAARIWKVTEAAARTTLEGFASRAMMLDLERDGRTLYILPPPMAGFFEFSLMRLRANIDQRDLSALFFRYINVEEGFIRDLFAAGETQLGRVLVNEPAIAPEDISQVLDYERASEVIRSASDIAVGLCYCRHKMAHLGRACDAPLDNCMTLNLAAQSLIRNGFARRIDASRGLEILAQARDRNLVQCADNVQRQVNFICHCCGCCCEALLAVRKLNLVNAMFTTNFIQQTDPVTCCGCGRCTKICPTEVISLVPVSDDEGEVLKRARVNEDFCLGCGVCVRNCPTGAIRMVPRERRVLTPVNTAHRLVLMAIERGKLQNLIFDNQAYLSHRALAAVLGAILRLPPVKRLMASRQLKSRYLERVMADVEIDSFSS
ncbi:MAG TPA: 4Fe-4S dicluster domain-containing protein [Geomonas sp.]|nr:4Fe-4S dicluster domain-containing protein [Geomonas sp.]